MKAKITLATCLLIIALSGQALAREEINLLDQRLLWRSPNPGTEIIFQDAGLTLQATSSSTGIYNLVPLNISTHKYDLLVIEMKTSRGEIGEVFWSAGGKGFSKKTTYPFYLGKRGPLHTYYLNLKPYVKSKIIDHLLIFPFSGPGRAEIKSLKLVESSLPEKILSAWQEFWGPRGREYAGKNCFIIKSPRLFGEPIFFYLNFMILISLIFSILSKKPKYTLFTIFFFWIFLECGSFLNNWIFFQRDLRFWGKSLEQKRELQNVGDFYNFIKFAEEKIPINSNFDLLTKPKYLYSRERASYYLYPRKPQAKASYLLIFDEEVSEDILKEYEVLEKFREKAYDSCRSRNRCRS